MIRIWIKQNRAVLISFSEEEGYTLITGAMLDWIRIHKRGRIRRSTIALMGIYYTKYPSGFVSMYYTEDIIYWHELKKLVKTIT